MLQKNLRCFQANVLCCFDPLLIGKNKSFGRHWVVPLRPGERKGGRVWAKSLVPRKLSKVTFSLLQRKVRMFRKKYQSCCFKVIVFKFQLKGGKWKERAQFFFVTNEFRGLEKALPYTCCLTRVLHWGTKGPNKELLSPFIITHVNNAPRNITKQFKRDDN